MQHCYSTISSYGFLIFTFLRNLPQVYTAFFTLNGLYCHRRKSYGRGEQSLQLIRCGRGSARCTWWWRVWSVWRRGVGGAWEKMLSSFFFLGDVRTHGKGVEKEGQIGFWYQKKDLSYTYIYIYMYILWTYSYVWLFWRYKMELRVRTNWWIDAAFGLMISHCDGSGDLTWNIVVSRCFKGIKF